jgi:hypothetical protein
LVVVETDAGEIVFTLRLIPAPALSLFAATTARTR